MVIMILEKVPVSLRGELTRWLIEPKTGVFVGTVSALVRDRLWEKACKSMKDGAGVLIHNADNEQGFAMKVWGERDRQPIDFDGLWLIRTVSG